MAAEDESLEDIKVKLAKVRRCARRLPGGGRLHTAACTLHPPAIRPPHTQKNIRQMTGGTEGKEAV